MMPRDRRVRVAWLVLVASLAAIVWTSTACFEAAEPGEAGPKSLAPDFDLVRLDGNPLRLADLRGKIVVLDFWATWCAPCEVQMPVLDALWQSGDHADLMIVGISVDTDSASDVAKWVEARGFEYPIVIGDQDLAMRYGVIGFPSLVIVDPNGGIYTRHTGVWSRPEIESVLDEIRHQPPAEG